MAQLEVYKTLEEKSEFFKGPEGMICGSVGLLFDTLTELQISGNYIFRGMNSAKYKLYNSAQREFLRREMLSFDVETTLEDNYSNWLHELIKEVKAWNYKSVENYFTSIGISNNMDMAYLSFMQHNGFPTPLLDFTSNPFIALYFAINGVEYNASDPGIDNCISLYYLDKESEFNSILNLDHEIKKERNLKISTFPDIRSNYSITIINHASTIYKLKNSMNIVNQEGCFVYNWHAVNPLEQAHRKLLNNLKNNLSKNVTLDMKENIMYCFNIHKSVIPKIKTELIKKGIDSRFVYPNIHNHLESIIEKSISNLIS